MPECQCENAGWCDLFKKEMTYDPPNWQWCKSLSEDQRRDYFNKMESTVRVLKKAPDEKKVDIVNFFDILPEKKSKYAVCVIPANDSAMELLDITRAGVKKYAEKCGADYIELSGDQNPNWTMSNKYRLNRVAKAYDKTLYLDCDIVVKDDAPNIFELTPDDKISAYDEYPIMKKRNDPTWIRNEQEAIFISTLDSFPDEIKERYVENGEFITESMINGGVLVIPKALADYYKQPSHPYHRFWCFDQNLLTLELPEEKLNNLTDEFNCEYQAKDFWRKVNHCYFIHLNGMSDKKDYRKHLLKQFSVGDFTENDENRFNGFKLHCDGTNNIPTFNSKINYKNIFNENKIGLFFNNLTPGGATTWLKDFVTCFKKDITGIIALEDHPEYNYLNCGIDRGFDINDMYELYEKSDIIIYWLYSIPSNVNFIPEFFRNNYKNKKIIFLSHSSLRVSAAYDLLIKMLKPNHFVCIDEYVSKIYSAIHIPPVVQKLNINRKPISKNILWHHRLERYKGVEVLADIIEAMPDYTFHIAGSWIPNIHDQKITHLVENRILSSNVDNVFYHGHLNDMSNLFSICSLSLSTSIDESFGLSVAESIINGIPTVSHSTGVGKYSDLTVPYQSYYGDWVKQIRICEQLYCESKNKRNIEEQYSFNNFKTAWENILC